MKYYRAQEYVFDMGAFGKHGIHELSVEEYNKINNESRCRRLVVLTPEDTFAKTLPAAVHSWGHMEALVKMFEQRELKRRGNEVAK